LIWDQALYTEQLVPQEALVEMFTGYTASIEEGQDYGYGWFIGEDNGHRIVQHSGVLPGYISNIMRYVDDNVTVIVLSNQRLLPLHQLNANLGDLLFAYVIQ
jgi:CubicO group peptidase (beta-lactamase class C family)